MTGIPKPTRPCSQPGCPSPATHGTTCATHGKPAARRRDAHWNQRKAGVYQTPDYRRARARTLALGYHQCATCGDTRRLSAHHLDHNARNNADSNLVCLCMTCHMRLEREHHDGRHGPQHRALAAYLATIGAQLPLNAPQPPPDQRRFF